MDYSSIIELLVFIFIFPFLVRLLQVENRGKAAKALLVILPILLIASFLPLIVMKSGGAMSTMDYIFEGSIAFGIMFFGYLAALLLLLKKDPNYDLISAVVFLASFISGFVGLEKYIRPLIRKNDLIELYPSLVWFVVFVILPIVAFFAYIGLYIAPSGEKKRFGLFKKLDDWGTNRPLLRGISRYFSLELNENSGWKQAETRGVINGFPIEVKGDNLDAGVYLFTAGDTGNEPLNTMPYQVNTVTLTVEGVNLTPALLSLKNARWFFFSDYRKAFGGILSQYASLPEFLLFDKFRINSGGKDFYQKILSALVTEVELILSKHRRSYPAWLIFSGNRIIYTKPYFMAGSADLSVDEMKKVIQVLISLAESIKEYY